MADYFAVLSRTLSGFGEPKPELRAKLYERARMTIRRQLDSHIPPLDGPALDAEMNKLEDAIKKVETGFGSPNVPLDGPKTEPAANESKPEPVAEESAIEEKKTATGKAGEKSETVKTPVEIQSEAVSVEEQPVPAKDKKSRWSKRSKSKKAQAGSDDSKQGKTGTSSDDKNLKAETLPREPADDKIASGKAKKTDSAAKEAAKTDQLASTPEKELPVFNRGDKGAAAGPGKPAELPVFEPDKTPVADPSESELKPAAKDEAVDPMDEWAREFLSAQEASKPEVAEALAEIQADQEKSGAAADKSPDKRAATIAAAATAAAAESGKVKTPAPELPVFDSKQDETIIIPPVPTAEADRRSGGVMKWSLIALLAFFVIGGAALALNWENRSQIASSIGLDGLFGDTVKPTPVKTIKITPDPEPESEPEPAVEAPTAPEPDTPKSEDRLTGDDETDQPATPAPEAPAVPPGTVDPAAPTVVEEEDAAASQPETGSEQPSPELPAAEAGAAPAVAQSAILYEEGGSSSENSFDTGRVVWSVVEEQGGEGEGKIPAIRGRVEVPSRQLVLIMTIKRNTDRALPASHLIELVFAVPDDFSGGSIGEISRYVLKENEQGRGDALIGVPARIADGIFLIALNNLESAQKTNEQLLRGRSWIDIPMAYRTGRRALVTLEKGVPGEAVFKEVFDAWDKLDNRP